jgi:hypothetical protein
MSPSNFWMGVITLLACLLTALYCVSQGYTGLDAGIVVGAVAAGPVTVVGMRESKSKVHIRANGGGG